MKLPNDLGGGGGADTDYKLLMRTSFHSRPQKLLQTSGTFAQAAPRSVCYLGLFSSEGGGELETVPADGGRRDTPRTCCQSITVLTRDREMMLTFTESPVKTFLYEEVETRSSCTVCE